MYQHGAFVPLELAGVKEELKFRFEISMLFSLWHVFKPVLSSRPIFGHVKADYTIKGW